MRLRGLRKPVRHKPKPARHKPPNHGKTTKK
jgi:hypothetical protein